MIVSLYGYTISDTKKFHIFEPITDCDTFSKGKGDKINTCSLYPGILIFGINIIIAMILVLLDFMQSYHS